MQVKNFLKTGRLSNRDPSARLELVQALDPGSAEDHAQLAELAREDPNTSVRVAAIARLHDPQPIMALMHAQGDHAEQIQAASESRLIALMAERALPSEAMQHLLQAGDAALFALLVINGVDAAQRMQALQHLHDEHDLLHVVQRSRFHDMRSAAAERLSQHDSLRAALAACRSRDKEVARQLQARLDERAAAEAERIKAGHAVTSTLASMQTLATSVWSPQTIGRRQALSERWQSLEPTLRAAHEADFDRAQKAVEAQVMEHRASSVESHSGTVSEVAAQASQSIVSAEPASPSNTPGAGVPEAADVPAAAVVAAAPEATAADYQALKAELHTLDLAALTAALARTQEAAPVKSTIDEPDTGENPGADVAGSDSATVATADAPAGGATAGKVDSSGPVESGPASGMTVTASPLKALAGVQSEPATRLLSHARAVAVLFDPPYVLNKARPGELQQRLKRVDALLDPQVAGSDVQFTALPYVTELAAHRAALVDRTDKARQESSDRLKATHRQFAALSGIVADGKWSPANSLLRRLQKKISAMEPAERKQVEDKLVRAEKQLAEMADWQDFAARPKLEALCEQMEALPGQELAPPALAKAVREYQAQWKSLGVSRASNDLWVRFKTAGDTAYEPCKAWFEQQQREREQKTANKRTVCDRLQSFVDRFDAENADWKSVQKEVSHAKREWSRNRVTDRKPDRALEKRFTDLLKPLEAAMSGQYEANEAMKSDLVERAAKLANGEINQHATNQARQLQAQWKLVGITRRKQDQVLWEQFNAHCRTIFKQQQESQRAQYQASMGHVFRAREIIKELRTLSRGDKADDSAVQRLSGEFDALEAFPERDRKGLEREFRSAVEACSRIQQTAARRRRQAGREEVQRRVALCEQLEAAVEDEALRHATLLDDVRHAWDNSETGLPKELEQLLERRRDAALAHLQAGTRYDYQEAEEARRDLLIEMEVAADVDTPVEDKARRMKFQLAKLQEGMSAGGVVDRKAQLKALEFSWLGLPPASVSVRDALNSRFLKAMGR